MDYPKKFIVSNQKEESFSIEMVEQYITILLARFKLVVKHWCKIEREYCLLALQSAITDILSYLAIHTSIQLNGLENPLKNRQTKVLKTECTCSLMQVENIAECSIGAFCSTFDLHKQ